MCLGSLDVGIACVTCNIYNSTMCHIYAYDVFMEGKIDPRCGVKPNIEVIAGSVRI